MTRKMVAKAFTSSCATGVALAAGRRELQIMRKLMKPFYCVLLCFVGCVFGASGGVPGSVIANGHTWSCSEAESSDESSSVTACIDGLLDDYPTGNLIVPNKAGGYTVTEVNLELYFVDNSLTGLTIPDTVKTMDLAVGEEANITSINLPSQLLYLKLDLPKLRSISLPSGLLDLELYSDELTSLSLPSTLTKFWGGCPLVKTLRIPASCDDVELWGFSSLENITVEPSNPQYSDANNVLYNKEKTSLYFIGAKYTTFTVPDSVTRIYLMDKLNVTSLAIGKNVSKIGKSFEKCVPKLTSVTVDPANQYFCMYDGCLYDINLTTRYWGTPGGGSTVSLPTAIDNTTLSFTTGGNANWTGQTSVSHDGIDSARSGQISDSQTTYFQTTVSGGGTIEFWWKVSSESNYDKLHFYVDRQDAVNAISGDTGWVHVSHSLSSGSHTLKWAYEKDSSSSYGSDCGWVDQVVWTPQDSAGVTITFNANGGCFDPEGTRVSTWTKSVTSGSQYGSLPVPARSFYRFDGWYTSASGGTRISDSSAVSSSGHTLYAHWAEDFTTSITASAAEPIDVSDGLTPSYTKYPVVLLPGDGTGSPYLTHAVYERALIIPANRFSRTGYAFSGWKVYDACSGREPYYDYMGIGGGYVGEYSPGSTLEFCGSTVLVAQWRANTYTCTVTFDANGGSIGTSPKTTKTVESGSTLGCLEVAWRTGYQLDGWYTSPSGGSKISESTIVTGDVTYYAHWTAGYEVRLNLNGGSIGCTPEVWYVPSGSPVGEDLPDTVSRSGYAFAGWWTAAEGGEEITAATIVTHAITCYAHWFPMTFSSGEKWHYEPGNCWRSGHIDANGSTYATMTVTGPGSIYFEWKTSSESNYDKLHFYVNGNEQLPAISGETDWVPETFKFTGTGSLTLKWEYTKYSSTDSGLDCGWIKNVVWTPTTMCTVTFNPNGGSVSPTTKSVESGSVIGPLPTPEWRGHSFGGWYTSANGGNSIDEDTPVTGNVTYYAHWTASTYTVTFNANGGSVSPASKAVTYDSTYGDLPPPTRIGYKFDGWYTSASGGTKVVSSTKVTITSNQTLYAHWTANAVNCTVTFNANGGSGTMAAQTFAGEAQSLTANAFTRAGYEFAGWATSAGGNVVYFDRQSVAPTGNLTLYAVWVEKTPPEVYFSIWDGVLAWADLNGATEVVIPNSVTNIGDGAFAWCESLTSVMIPDSVTSIGNYAFDGCSGLTSVMIGNSVTSIGAYAFRGCDFASVTIPASVTSIGDFAFNGYSGLTSVHISDLAAWCRIRFGISANPLSGADNLYLNGVLLTNLTIPSNVTSIGDHAFQGYIGLTSVTIPDGVTSIGYGAFFYCSGLMNVTMGNSVTNIGDYAFSGCSGLTSVTIPNSVTSIGSYAFNHCSDLTSVTIPEGVTSNGENAFSYCSFTSVTIPDSIAGIGECAFEYCGNLLSFVVGDGNANYSSANGLILSKDGRTLIEGVNGDVTVPDGVTSIGVLAFAHRSGLTSVTIPDSVTSVKRKSFYGCSGLKSMSLPNSLKGKLDSSAFEECPADMIITYRSPLSTLTVEFNANGGTLGAASSTRSVTEGRRIGELPEPTRTGYAFAGWWTAASGGAKVVESTKVNGNVTYYAHWTANTYTVVFNANGGMGEMAEQLMTYDQAAQLAGGQFIKSDSLLRGWATAAGGGMVYRDGVTVKNLSAVANDVVTLYAVWQKKPAEVLVCEVAFGGAGVVTMDAEDNIVVTLTNNVSMTVEIPDNIGRVTIDLNGNDITGACGGAAIRIVSGEGRGRVTRLAVYDLSDGEKGKVVGDGAGAGIEVVEDAAPGVKLDVEAGINVLNGDGTEQGLKPKLVGTGTVKMPETWKTGQKVMWKAVAAKGSVFANWEGSFVDSLKLSRNELRNPSLVFAVPADFDPNGIVAVFVLVDGDQLGKLALRKMAPIEPNVEVEEFEVLDDSESYVTASVKGLPTGLKYDSKTMTISGKATKPGVYKVTVSATNKTVKKAVTATFEIVVPNLVSEKLPGLEKETDAYGVVTCGVAFDPGLVDCSPENGWTVKAAGLPTGLKFVQDKTTGAYSITGVPTKAGTFTVTFTASKKGEKNQVATITLVTKALPEWAVGTFSGFVECYAEHGSGSDFGSITMTVTANGKVSGKMALVGTNYTFGAASYAMVDGEGCFVVEADAKAGKVVRPLRLLVIPCDAPESSPSLFNARAVGSLDSPLASEILMCRGMWKDKATAAAAKTEIAKWAGVYTLSTADGGYLSLTVGKDGNVKASGKLADGTSVSATTPLLHDGETGFLACVYAAPSAYKGGSLAMSIGFNDGEGGVRTLGNSRGIAQCTSLNPQATSVYGEGFSRDVEFVGAFYDKGKKLNDYYEALRVSLDGAPNLGYVYKETDFNDLGRKVTMSENRETDAIDTLWQDGMTAAVNEKGAIVAEKATKPVQGKETKEWSYDGTNDGALTLSFTQATGIFKGSYTFWYDYMSAYDDTTGKSTMTHTSKKVSFEGIMVQGEVEMRGFYLWDASSAYGDPKTGKEKTYKFKESYPVYLVRP